MGCGCGCTESFVPHDPHCRAITPPVHSSDQKKKGHFHQRGLRWFRRRKVLSILYRFGLRSHGKKKKTVHKRAWFSFSSIQTPPPVFPPSSRLVSHFQKVDQPLHLTWSSAHYSPLSCLALNRSFFAGALIYSLNPNWPQCHKCTNVWHGISFYCSSLYLLSVHCKSTHESKIILYISKYNISVFSLS